MLGDDGRAADIVFAALEQHRHGWRLGKAADHRALGVAIDDRVADDMHALRRQAVDRAPQVVEFRAAALHRQLKFLERQVGRLHLDEARGGIHDITRREEDVPAVAA